MQLTQWFGTCEDIAIYRNELQVQNSSQKQRSDSNHQKSDSIQTYPNRQSGLVKIDTNQTKLESNQSNPDEG